MRYDFLIVGAGFAGCVLAERLASQRDKKVLLIDMRDHIGGNAHDSVNEHGIRVHHYGPHLFHTNDERIIRYLSQFTAWHPYEHRVLAYVNGMYVPMPINRTTVNMLTGKKLSTDDDVKNYFEQVRESIASIRNSEDIVISKVGRRFYDLLYKGYTTKHWGVDPSQLAASVCARLPVRTNDDDRYFDDRFQMMPLNGYASLFTRMTAHKNISISLSTHFQEIPAGTFNQLIFTGPIDEYFGYMFGRLPYRSLRFEFETLEKEFAQPVAQVNYPNDYEFTRITEFKHINGQINPRTTIAREYPLPEGDPYYPVPNEENTVMYSQYQRETLKLSTVTFVGRLATYRYYNMDQVVAQALSAFEGIVT